MSKRCDRWVLLGFLFLVAVPPALPAAGLGDAEFNRRAEWLRQDVLKNIADLAVPKSPNANSTRNLPHGAYYLLTFGRDPAHDVANAETLLRRAFDAQDMNPASPHYGDVPWSIDKPNEVDANAIEFTMSPIGPILLRHADRLSPELLEVAKVHIRAAIPVIRRHRVPITYTNIFLMRAENLLLLGEALDDQAIADEGEGYFNDWIRYTRQFAVTEYDSPVYTAVQIDCVNFAYTYTSRTKLKDKLRACLDYLWSDVAANTLRSRGMLTGSHSRCYEFVTGTGCLDRQLYLSGLRDDPPQPTLINDCGRDIAVVTDGGYRPDPAILALADQPERIVLQKFREGPNQDKTDYITSDFAVGSSSVFAGPQDRQISVDFAGPDTLPTISMGVDGWDSPYGTYKFKGKDGHSKARKLRNVSAVVQDTGTVLALMEITPDLKKVDVNSLSTNLLFPAAADRVLIDGKFVPMDKPFETDLTTKSVVALRVGHAGAAMRIFAADGCGGQSPVIQAKLDSEGIKAHDTARLVAYAWRDPQGHEQHLEVAPTKVGILITAAICTTDQDLDKLASLVAAAPVQETNTDDTWTAKTTMNGRAFTAAIDYKTGACVARQLDGKDLETARFSVNGQDLTAKFLDPLELPAVAPSTSEADRPADARH